VAAYADQGFVYAEGMMYIQDRLKAPNKVRGIGVTTVELEILLPGTRKSKMLQL
jgi:hypothetical protein